MPPKTRCSSKSHDPGRQCTRFFKLCGKQVPRQLVDFLIEIGDIRAHSTYLCQNCKDDAAIKFECSKNTDPSSEPTSCLGETSGASYGEPAAKKRALKMRDFTNEIIEEIDGGYFSIEDLQRIAAAIGRSQSKCVYEDSMSISKQFQDADLLQTFNMEEWLLTRNSVVIAFLIGIGGRELNNISNRLQLLLVRCVEQIYYFRNLNFVAPLAFMKNLLAYYLTGSKAVVTQDAGYPSSSYSGIQAWIKNHSEDPLQCPDNADVVTFLDNNQVLQRKWRVQTDFKSTSSVITTIVHIIPDKTAILQHKTELSPRQWLNVEERVNVKDALLTKIQQQEDSFSKYRDQFISAQLNIIFQQQTSRDGTITDVINDEIISPHTKPQDRYTFIPSRHPDEKPVVIMGDPAFENPCSYESVEKVFNHILEQTNIGSSDGRKWTMVGCDGLPYALGSRIQDSFFKCVECTREFVCREEFEEHRKEHSHCMLTPLVDCRKYNNIVLIPGLGHIEMNMVKAIVKFLWEPAFIDLARMLGFNSIRALQCCQNCSDHHKSWQMVQIFLHAMGQELLLPYVQKVILEGGSPSPAGYYHWLQGVQNPNYNFMKEVVFTYCLAIHVFRAGVRRNNTEAINIAKTKFSSLFFGLNMPFYMEIITRDSLVRLQCPPDVNGFIGDHESYSVSGNDSKGEGGDFVLESKNRKTKMFIPAGLPDNNKWLQVCRNVDKLEKINERMSQIIDVCDADDDYTYSPDLAHEIYSFRRIIRKQKYLRKDNESNHNTLGGKILDKELINFGTKCKENRLNFISGFVENGTFHKKYEPIFILEAERTSFENIANKTKSEIACAIEVELQRIEDTEMTNRWKKIKNKTKADFLEFLKEIQNLECDL